MSSFSPLKLVADDRAMYGLRQNDYAKYRSHCAHKVRYLRKQLGLSQIQGGKKKTFVKKDIKEAKDLSEKHLKAILFDAERAWAHAGDLEATKSGSENEKHATKRLGRAAKHAETLFSLASSDTVTLDLHSKAEALAYLLILRGNLHFHKKGQNEATLSFLVPAYRLLQTMSNIPSSVYYEVLTSQFMDEIEPLIRYTAYRSQIDTRSENWLEQLIAQVPLPSEHADAYSSLLEELNKEVAAAPKSSETNTVQWKDSMVSIRNVQMAELLNETKEVLGELEKDNTASLASKRLALYDRALSVFTNAEESASEMHHKMKALADSFVVPTLVQDLALANSFFSYLLDSVRIKRDFIIVSGLLTKYNARKAKIDRIEADVFKSTGVKRSTLARTKERKLKLHFYPSIIKMYDGVVYSFDRLLKNEAVEKDDTLQFKISMRLSYISALRAYYLSESYLLLRKNAEAYHLIEKSSQYLDKAEEYRAILADDSPSVTNEYDFSGDLLANIDFEKLRSDIASLKKAIVLEEAHEEALRDIEDPADGLDRLDITDGPAKKKTRKLPFYDIAFNYVVSFDLETISELATGKKPEPAAVKEVVAESVKPAPASAGQSKWGFGLFGRK